MLCPHNLQDELNQSGQRLFLCCCLHSAFLLQGPFGPYLAWFLSIHLSCWRPKAFDLIQSFSLGFSLEVCHNHNYLSWQTTEPLSFDTSLVTSPCRDSRVFILIFIKIYIPVQYLVLSVCASSGNLKGPYFTYQADRQDRQTDTHTHIADYNKIWKILYIYI